MGGLLRASGLVPKEASLGGAVGAVLPSEGVVAFEYGRP
jgi:hypothetical protein